MFKSLLQYSITKPVTAGICFNVTIILLGIAWVVLITVINVAAVGYEIVIITSTVFNSSYTLWYESFPLLSSWVSSARTCNGSIINLNEGVPHVRNANPSSCLD